MIKKFILFITLSSLVYSYTLSDAKKLRYSTITPQTKEKYLYILNTLAEKKDAEAIYLLAQTYEEGVFVKKDISKAISYYEKSKNLGYKLSDERLNYLLLTDKKHKQDNIFSENNLNKLEDKVLNKLKDLSVSSTEQFILLFPLFESMGYEFDNFIISSAFNNFYNINLKKSNNKADAKLADILAGENITKQSIVKLLKTANKTDLELKEMGYKVKLVKLSMGLKVGIELSITKVKK